MKKENHYPKNRIRKDEAEQMQGVYAGPEFFQPQALPKCPPEMFMTVYAGPEMMQGGQMIGAYAQKPSETAKRKWCPVCGMDIEASAKFCTECGAPQPQPRQDA